MYNQENNNNFSEYSWHVDDYQSNASDKTVYGVARPVGAAARREKSQKRAKPAWLRYTAVALAGMIIGGSLFAGGMAVSGGFNGNSAANAAVPAIAQVETPKAETAPAATTIPKNAPNADVIAYTGDGEMSIEDIADKVGPSVVGIITTRVTTTLFGTSAPQTGGGSGIIVSADGYIVTNEHVISESQEIVVELKNSKQYKAKVIGADKTTDIAVLKIEESNLPVAELGQSASTKVGELAVAIGNPLGQAFANTVTHGIVSAIGREFDIQGRTYNLIQTDAAINPGNSGGALVNKYGQVIGINTIKIGQGAEGLGFAIPIDEVVPIMESLMKDGYVKGRRAPLGLSLTEVTTQMAIRYKVPVGVYINEVGVGSAAEKAGMRPDEVIVKADGKEVKTVAELNEIRDAHAIGESFEIVTNSPDETASVKTYTVTIAELVD